MKPNQCFDDRWREFLKAALTGKNLLFLVTMGCWLNALSQDAFVFHQLRYEDDFSYLKKDSSSAWYNSIKYHPISAGGETYISLGGEVRYQYFYYKNQDWGEAPEDRDGFIFTRYLLHADLHFGPRFRTFIQLQSSFANGTESPPSPVDENQLDLHQAFVEAMVPIKEKKYLAIRVGRQELSYGSQRLVATREGPNNRQSFDGARLLYRSKSLGADCFYSDYVLAKRKIFDDHFSSDVRLWGGYLVKNKIPVLQNVDLYYLGLWKVRARFDDGTGKEIRHSIGTRIWGGRSFRYDIEGLYQFGRFAGKDIKAWTFSINTGYTFRVKHEPQVGLKTELISGDRSYGDNKLQTFNPLFPKGSYFGLAALIGPVNLFDIHPSASFGLTKNLSIEGDCDVFWRYSIHDGIYGPNVGLIYSGKNNNHKYIGDQFSADLIYTPNNFVYFRSEFTWFNTGEFLRSAGEGKDILFAGVTVQVKF